MILKIAHTYRSSFTGLSRETLAAELYYTDQPPAQTLVVRLLEHVHYLKHMHRSVADAGIVITLFGVGSVLGSAAGGCLIDKIGFRPVQIIASITGGVFCSSSLGW